MEKLLLRHARILDPSSDLDQIGDLLLVDGSLQQAGGTVEASDAQVIDASGMVVAPGLVTCMSICATRALPKRKTSSPAVVQRRRAV